MAKEENVEKTPKTIKVKKKVEKVSDAHLAEMQQVVNKINALQFNIGRIEAQKHMALHQLEASNDAIKQMQDLLMREYGSFDINLETGKINWDEKAPQPNGVEK